MQRERYLAAGVGVLCLVALLALLVIPGAIAEYDTGPPSSLNIQEVTVTPVSADGNAATFQFNVSVRHRGGTANNVTALVRAVDEDNGLVVATDRVRVGSVSDTGEVRVGPTLTVERSGNYEVTVILYQDGRRVDQERSGLNNVGGISPSPIAFKRFDSGVQTIETTIQSTDGDRTTIGVGVRLWNTGVEPAGDVSVELVARQPDSNVVADRTTITVETIGPGVTVRPTAQLQVPPGYAYRLDAILKHEGVVVSSATSVVDLDPERKVDTNTTFEDVN
ncbi:MAG: hypothetical protein ABEJ86_01305, partial [Halococcoides sp.]